ncbi:MAG: hypothetical protein K2W96_09260 [Gemmataceae bacterium]|nr:hypothetical protein [Gemmataceae bacterium]
MPACARMILASHGCDRSEADLRSLLGTDAGGTPPRALFQLSTLGFSTRFGTGSLAQLHHLLASNIPPLVLLSTSALPYWKVGCDHAVVVVGSNDAEVFLNDPAFSSAPQAVAHADFLQAWAPNKHTYATITPYPASKSATAPA